MLDLGQLALRVRRRRRTVRRSPIADSRSSTVAFAAGRAVANGTPRTCYGNRYILIAQRVSFGADPTSLAWVDLRQLPARCRGS
jgi:hypothetical protein